MITVMGATGRVGGKIVDSLLRAGERVRAIGRSETRLAVLKQAGAETLAGDASDVAFLTRAFRGADAVFTLMAYDPQVPDYHAHQNQQGEASVEALRQSGVRRVVFLSSVGADQPSGTGVIGSLHAQEARLRRLEGGDVLMLRPTYFFENFQSALGVIESQGVHADALAPDLAIPMIATRDIATAAAQALRARDWSGVVTRELLGPRDLSVAEATQILGRELGKPDLEYVQLPYADLTAALAQMGFSQDLAGHFAELARGLNEGRIVSLEGRRAENTTPTRFEDFAAELVRADARA